MNRSYRCRFVEALADFPRFLLVSHCSLQIAPRHVQTDGVIEHMIKCLVDQKHD
jgi:hypothetical protein